MTTSAIGRRFTDGPALDDQVSENVRTMMFRAGYRQTSLANALHIGQTTLSRRLDGKSSWLWWEVARLAEVFHLTIDEMTTGLPSRSEWQTRHDDLCACRDSNPKPSDP